MVSYFSKAATSTLSAKRRVSVPSSACRFLLGTDVLVIGVLEQDIVEELSNKELRSSDPSDDLSEKELRPCDPSDDLSEKELRPNDPSDDVPEKELRPTESSLERSVNKLLLEELEHIAVGITSVREFKSHVSQS